jgi:hypothetical protein
MAHNLRPFRQYNEMDVVNLFAYSGNAENGAAGIVATKGLAVKVAVGWTNDANSNPVELLGSVGASYNNVVSQRYGVKPKVTIAASGDAVLGLTLMDVRELDENGEKLVFNPRKAAEMGVVVSGQAVPILTKGLVTYSGALGAAVGNVAYVSGTAGEIAGAATLPTNATKIGKFLSNNDANGTALLKIEL